MKSNSFSIKNLNTYVASFFTLIFLFFFLLRFSWIQEFLLNFAENIVLHASLNHEAWKERFNEISALPFILPLAFVIFFAKFFTSYFSGNVKNSFLNLLRCVACLMVYMFHAFDFTASRCTNLLDKNYMRIFHPSGGGGVCIFFMLGGYLAGKGFLEGRYSFSIKDIFRYYKNKFFKVIVPTFSFIFLCCVLLYPSFIKDNPTALLKFLTFSYNGDPSANGFGSLWYIFSLAPLYLLTPLFSLAAKKASDKKARLAFLMILLFALGFLYRFLVFRLAGGNKLIIYTPFFANIDLFFCGICLNGIPKLFSTAPLHDRRTKDFSLFALILFIILCAFYVNIFFYQVLCPSIYILLTGLCILSYSDEEWVKSYNGRLEKVIAFFSGISFEFYLFHLLVLYRILPVFKYQNCVPLHFKYLAIGFTLTFILAFGFHKTFEKKK